MKGSVLYDKIIDVTLYTDMEFTLVSVQDGTTGIPILSLDKKGVTLADLISKRARAIPLSEAKTKYVSTSSLLQYVYIPSGLKKINGEELVYVVQVARRQTTTLEQARYAVVIKTPDTGLKPDITLQISRLPGEICYDATLRIKNLNLNLDVRSWDYMRITAGYKNSLQKTFVCPIFNSYVESPNPDGVTVFKGLTVGDTEDVFIERDINIDFNTDTVVVQKLLEDCIGAIGPKKMTLKTNQDRVFKQFLQSELPIDKNNYRCKSIYTLLNWLTQNLVEWGRIWSETNPLTIYTSVAEREFYIGSFEGIADPANDSLPAQRKIYTLDQVTSATFTGAILEVVAPWIPDLNPDDYFTMPANFYQMNGLPNISDSDLFIGKRDQYKVLKMSINFGTCSGDNSMSITAIPSQYTNEDAARSVSTEKARQHYIQRLAQVRNNPIELQFGEPSPTVIEENANTDFWEDTTAKSLGVNNIISVGSYKTFSEVAEASYINVGKFMKPADIKESDLYTGVWGVNGLKYYGGTYLFPLIIAATWQEQLTREKVPIDDGRKFRINQNNPDMLYAGYDIIIPNISSWESIKPYKDLYKKAADVYEALDEPNEKKLYTTYISAFRNIYIGLGGTL